MTTKNAKIFLACIGMSCLYIIVLWWLHSLSIRDAINITEHGDLDYLITNDIDNVIVEKTISPTSQTITRATSSKATIEPPGKERNAIINITIPDELPKSLQLEPTLVAAMNIHNTTMAQKQCCSHWDQRQRRRNKNKERVCRGICFTPQACSESGDRIFPFRDEQEKRDFRTRKHATDFGAWKNETRRKCMKHKPHQPPNRWNTTSPFPFADDLPPPGCSIFTGSGGSGSFQNLIIIPGAKLAFCGIPKVGITNWLQFTRFVMGAHDYTSFPHGKPDLQMWKFDNLHPEVQERIWNDPEWTFATMLRNPAERLLSAYLDKLQVRKENGSIAKSLKFNESLTFDVFLERLEMEVPEDLNCRDNEQPTSLTGINWCTDPHWRPQVWGCGMSEKIDRFDFIGSLDHAEKHSRALLERVGLWESHGKHYRSGKSKRTASVNQCVQLFPLQDEFESTPLSSRHVGFQKKKDYNEKNIKKKETLSWDTIGHAQGAGKKKDEYYTPELHQKVEEKLYRADYQVWNLLDNENGDWVSGKDILPQLLKAQEKK